MAFCDKAGNLKVIPWFNPSKEYTKNLTSLLPDINLKIESKYRNFSPDISTTLFKQNILCFINISI